MGGDCSGEAPSHSDGFGRGGCRPDAKKVTPVSPVEEDPALLATMPASSSSLAGLWRLPPHVSSRRFGGAESIGPRLLTVPSEGRGHASPLLAKPRSRSCAARTARMVPEEAPSTTAISRLPSRVADATRL